MITFLPYTDFDKVAECLDDRRLGKQRVEAVQILRIINSLSQLNSHPAVKMWRDHPYTLARYAHSMVLEWTRRGYRDTLLPEILTCLSISNPVGMPLWLSSTTQSLHILNSHRSNLLAKDYNYYKQFGWEVPLNLPYFWPTHTIKVKVVNAKTLN